ncbi:uncharacterized protein LOC118019677 isoform X1 [Mirounga leonina]|uniref:uncharacterized protein LOC118019677 isoform X1 n=1 Tax=Mirounga leonina TaxID=9715 RepID=UPI00156BF0AB|nr:uncharacterized protein LOC118019677 isoform X1 [Mirounga leonina]XP_034874958.1 uncharacterized protein LOC118019677 isoform X1 [Mirounga leonina]XP_034874959.1 uncharacterized protein LOC118019677 isoform X1 [Mirounga leonina]
MPSFRLSLKFLICFALRKNQAWAWWDRLSALLQWYWQRTFDEPLVFRTEDAGRLRAEHQAGLLNYEGCQTSERKAELGPSHPGEPQDEVSEAQRHEVSSQTHPASEDHTKNWNLGLWFEVQHSFHALCSPFEGGDWSLPLLLMPSLGRPLPRSSAQYGWLDSALPLLRVSLTLPLDARAEGERGPPLLTMSHLATRAPEQPSLDPESHIISLHENSSVIFWAEPFSTGFNLSPRGWARRQLPPHPSPTVLISSFCPCQENTRSS